jgi:dihydroorotate dehydrogenase electron transfer subunit
MTDNRSASGKGVFESVVCSNKQIGESFYRLGLEFSGAGAEAFGGIKAGQFAQLDLSGTALPAAEAIPEGLADKARRNIILRRPFSFCDVTRKDNRTRVEILYCVLGPATVRMMALSGGDSVSVIGPLGRGFSPPEGKRYALLVAGGMGAGPLLHLGKVIVADFPKMEVVGFAGARTRAALPFERSLDEISRQLGFSLGEFAEYGVKSQLATDDGTAGYEGLVTECFSKWLDEKNLPVRDTIVYACGPEAMLAQVAEIAKDKDIDCEVSMERRMACGIGLCQSCAVECKVDGSNRTVYKLCCEDGPVFNGKEVVFVL